MNTLLLLTLAADKPYSPLVSLPMAYCYDRKTDCANWAKEGECENKNTLEFMLQTCPLSCGVCKQRMCDDKSPSCAKMHERGDCEAKPKTSLKACATSCGVCTVRCADQHSECGTWASEGECNEHADFMTEACPVSCNTCTRTCIDRHDDCPGWTAEGQCWKNAAFMHEHCPRSCDVCPEVCEKGDDGEEVCTRPCKDTDPKTCNEWREQGQCRENPTAVAVQCPESCGLCVPVCIDQHKHCASWAKEGGCVSNHAYMLNRCPASCGMCARIKAAMKYGDAPGSDWPTESADAVRHDEM